MNKEGLDYFILKRIKRIINDGIEEDDLKRIFIRNPQKSLTIA